MNALYSLPVIAALAVAPAYGACSYPPAPTSIPDGNTATLAEMVAAQKAVKEFDALITAYTSCLKLELDAAVAKSAAPSDKKQTEEQQAELKRMTEQEVQKHNAAVEDDEAIAARFNEQVKVFKAKSDKDKEEKKKG